MSSLLPKKLKQIALLLRGDKKKKVHVSNKSSHEITKKSTVDNRVYGNAAHENVTCSRVIEERLVGKVRCRRELGR